MSAMSNAAFGTRIAFVECDICHMRHLFVHRTTASARAVLRRERHWLCSLGTGPDYCHMCAVAFPERAR